MNGVRLLLDGLFDDAGLCPPASLPLPDVVRRYAASREGPAGWMLGRLVVPIHMCAALEAALDDAPDVTGTRPWRLSVIGSGSAEDDRQALADLRLRQQADAGRLRIDAVRVRAATPLDVRRARVLAADGWPVYCEPVRGEPVRDDGPSGTAHDIDAILDAIAIAGLRVTLRAGGTSPAEVPSCDIVGRLLAGCVQRGIALEASGDLHHAVTGQYPLTDTPGSPRVTLIGYLNLLVAAGVAEAVGAAAVRAPEVVAALARLLALTSTPVISAGGVLEWAGDNGPLTEGRLGDMAASARALVRGIATHAFDDAVADARALHLV